jgi:hypothetical protein
MASVPAISDSHAATAALFTSGLVQRASPVVRTPRRPLRSGSPGQLASRIEDFGMRLGLSHTSRWALDAKGGFGAGSTATAPVRPPLNYWPWGDADEPAQRAEPIVHVLPAPASSPRRPKRGAANQSDRRLEDLRRMLGIGQSAPQSGATAVASRPTRRRAVSRRDRVVHRGLPQTLARRSGTSRGAPGDIAQRMRPEAVDLRAIGTRAAAAPPPQPNRAVRAAAAPEPHTARGPGRFPDATRRTSDGGDDRPAITPDAADSTGGTLVRGLAEPILRRTPTVASTVTLVPDAGAPTSHRDDDVVRAVPARDVSPVLPTTAAQSLRLDAQPRPEFSSGVGTEARSRPAAPLLATMTGPPQAVALGSVPAASRAFPGSAATLTPTTTDGVGSDPSPETSSRNRLGRSPQIAGADRREPFAAAFTGDHHDPSAGTSGTTGIVVPATQPPAYPAIRTAAAASSASVRTSPALTPLSSPSLEPARVATMRDVAVDGARSIAGRDAATNGRRGVQPNAPTEALVSEFPSPAVHEQTPESSHTTTARRPEIPAIGPPSSLRASTADPDHDRSAAGRSAEPLSLRATGRPAPTTSPPVARFVENNAPPSARDPAIRATQPKIRRAGEIAGIIRADTLRSVDDVPAAPIAHRTTIVSPMAVAAHAAHAAHATHAAHASERAPDGHKGSGESAIRLLPTATAPTKTITTKAKSIITKAMTTKAMTTKAMTTAATTNNSVASTVSPQTAPSATNRPDPSLQRSPAAELRAGEAAEVRSDRSVDESGDLGVRRLRTAPPLAGAAAFGGATPLARTNDGSVDNAAGARAAHRRIAAELAAPAHDAAARFRAILRRTPATTSPLPSRWRPLATAIVGERAVRISTGPASRAALQAAGAIAATSGNVVHLARPLRGEGDAHLLAHELTHVANPSPAPRFFNDHRDTPEERRAELVADVIRRSPVLPRPSAGPGAPGAMSRRARRAAPTLTSPTLTSLATGRRSEHQTATAHQTNDPMTVSASALAAQITGVRQPRAEREASRSSGQRPSNHESSSSAASSRPTFDVTRSRREFASDGGQSTAVETSVPSGVHGTWPMLSSQLDSSSLTNFVDWIMEQLEDRIGRELERRGGRYRGEF